MRVRDEFTDVSSEGYNEWAKRAAERGGAEEYATSVEEEQATNRAALIRNIALTALSAGVPAMRVIQMNRALQAAVTAARATPAGQGLAQALTRNTPLGTSPATPFGWGARDSALQHGFAGGSVGSGLLPSVVPMFRHGYGDGAEEHFYGLVGDMYEVGDPDSTWPFPESWFPNRG